MLNFYDFIQVYVFTTNHHLKEKKQTNSLQVFSNFRSNEGWSLSNANAFLE